MNCKRIRPKLDLLAGDDLAGRDAAEVEARAGGEVRLRFGAVGDAFRALLERHGTMPLPPYIPRPSGADERDRLDYQTTLPATKARSRRRPRAYTSPKPCSNACARAASASAS